MLKLSQFKAIKWEYKQYTIEYKLFNGQLQYVVYDTKKNCMIGFNEDINLILKELK